MRNEVIMFFFFYCVCLGAQETNFWGLFGGEGSLIDKCYYFCMKIIFYLCGVKGGRTNYRCVVG